MIVVSAELSDGRMVLTVDGHANAAEDGRVCAAVSAITQTAILGLEAVARQFPQHLHIDVKETTT